MPRVLKPSADTIKPLRATGALLGTCHQPSRVTQAGGQLGPLTRSFSISLVSGSTSMISWSRAETWGRRRERQFDKAPQPRPCCHRGVPTQRTPVPSHRKQDLAAHRAEGLQQQSEPGGPRRSPALVPKHRERPPGSREAPHREKSLFYGKSLETRGLTSSTPRLP